MTDKKKGIFGRLALLITTMIWGTSFVIMKNTLDSITPTWILVYRFTGAAAVLFLACIPRLKKIDRGYLKGGVCMGIFLAAAYIVQTYGLYYTTPAKNAFLTSTYCIFVPFINWGLFRKRLGGYKVFAGLMCLVGVGFVCLGGTEAFTINIGDILTIFCGLGYAFHIIITDKFVDTRDALLLTMLQFAVAAVICFVAALIFEPIPRGLPTQAWWSIVYLSLMCTGACFLFQTWGQKYTPPATTAIILILESVFGATISVLMGQENLTFATVTGFCLIFFAIFISETKLAFLKRKK